MDNIESVISSGKGIRIVVILVLMIFSKVFIEKGTYKILSMTSETKPSVKRLRTMANMLSTGASLGILMIGTFMILKEVGFDIMPLLASAGIIGLAVGFGAQTLVKDVISGFFLILEGQFNEGDEVEINGKKGVVEKINLRTVAIRGNKKEVHIIPNGSITLVTNFSKD